jgi:hypothetical protein
LALKFLFVTPPQNVSGGWWIPVDAAAILQAWRDVFGWSEMQWMADAWSRHAPGGVWFILLGAIAAGSVAAATAWMRRPVDPLATALLLVAVIYAVSVTLYSRLFEPILMMRTLLPGLLPFLAGLARGIATHPVAWRRSLAATMALGYGLVAAIPVARLAMIPEPGLRELAATAKAACRPGDLLVSFRAMDYSLSVYQCPPAGTVAMLFDQSAPMPPQESELRERLARLAPDRRVIMAYRDDYYLRRFREVVDQVIAEGSRGRQAPAVAWKNPEFVLLIAEPKS